MTTNAEWLWRGTMKRTREELMQELNKTLETNFNWSRLNRLDLERIVKAVEAKLRKDN